MNQIVRCLVLLSTLLFVAAAAAREKDEIPPANGKRLSEIVLSLEKAGHTVITDVDFDERVWIVRVYKAGFEFEIRVDPVSGEILGIRPVV
jgi:hypothetical protein